MMTRREIFILNVNSSLSHLEENEENEVRLLSTGVSPTVSPSIDGVEFGW